MAAVILGSFATRASGFSSARKESKSDANYPIYLAFC